MISRCIAGRRAKRLARLTAIMLAALILTAAPAASQADNLVANADFEAGALSAPGGEAASDWQCWQIIDSEANTAPAFWYMPAHARTTEPDRNNFQRILAGKFNGPSEGGIVQAVATEPGELYGLEMDTSFAFVAVPSSVSLPVARIGYDLTGQTSDSKAGSITWVNYYTGRFRTQFKAVGESVSIWRGVRYARGDSVVLVDCDNVAVTKEMKPDVRITRPPTLAAVGPYSARIEWETDLPSTSRLNYGLIAPSVEALGVGESFTPPLCGYRWHIEEEASVIKHSMTIEKLLPGTEYHFNVYSDGGPEAHAIWSQDFRFRTSCMVLADAEDPDEARNRLGKLIADENSPRDVRGRALLAIALIESNLGDVDAAVKALDRCSTEFPEYADITRCRKCCVLAQAGKADQAASEQQRFADKGSAWSLAALGWVRSAQGRHEEALKSFKDASAAANDLESYEETMIGAYCVHLAMGDLRAAAKVREELISIAPSLLHSGMLAMPWQGTCEDSWPL